LRRVAVPLSLTREAARPRDGRSVSLGGPTMGVTWSLQAWAPHGLGDAILAAAVQAACDTVVAQAAWTAAARIASPSPCGAQA